MPRKTSSGGIKPIDAAKQDPFEIRRSLHAGGELTREQARAAFRALAQFVRAVRRLRKAVESIHARPALEWGHLAWHPPPVSKKQSHSKAEIASADSRAARSLVQTSMNNAEQH